MGNYVEPDGYFTPSMKRILEKGTKEKTGTEKPKATQKPAPKKSK